MPTRPPNFDYEPFNDFTRITKRKFRVLEDRFGCVVTDITRDSHECAAIVRYVNETTAIHVNFSIMRPLPVVSLHAVESKKQRLRDGYGLVWFIRERCPESECDEQVCAKLTAALAAFENGADTRMFSRILNTILGRYASVLEEHAADFLNGDFTIAPALDILSNREYRRLQYAGAKNQATGRSGRTRKDK